MKIPSRRKLLQTAAATAVGGIAAAARGQPASTSPRTPFLVAPTFIPIAGGGDLFPVRRIYCIGRNYAAHSREMGSDPAREPPFFFQKPTDAVQVVLPGETGDHPYPPLTKNYHYEVELVAAIGRGGRDIPVATALGDERKPWEIGKSFDRSAPLGPLHAVPKVAHFTRGAIWLKVNGEVKQSANLDQMLWSVAEQVSRLSAASELMPGDIIFSGTPENVGPVVRGDLIDAHIDGLPDLRVRIV